MGPMAVPALVSLGYEGRSVEDLIGSLRQEAVSVLIDVRLTPLSRKPGLSKRRLAEALGAAGIGYVHLRALGNPRDNRSGFRAGEASSREFFRDLLRTDGAVQALDHVAELLDGGTVALLCFERRHETCHRHLVAEELRRVKPSVQVVEI
jgi:uncharacterized protein (DUF488 family)